MSAVTGFRPIVAEYRRRIAAGELQPGDRLPSTRALAAEWQVAPATAARALTELTRAGATRTQARMGTVVAPPPVGAARAGLERHRVAAAAIALADEGGLELVSMRAVAARLQVAPMSLYRYVDSKQQLLFAMADAAYGEVTYPESSAPDDTGSDSARRSNVAGHEGRGAEPGPWRQQLEASARALWDVYRRHPWLAQMESLARPLPLPALLRHGDVIAGALRGLGLTPAQILELQVVLFAHGAGLAANRERETAARGETGVTAEQWERAQVPVLRDLAASHHLTHLAALFDELPVYDFDLDRMFDVGLQALLDGFEVIVRAAAANRPAASSAGPKKPPASSADSKKSPAGRAGPKQKSSARRPADSPRRRPSRG